ncbi:DUF6415 family natural product biosynthesis protein [Streptomyces sp. NPDC005708]|uniref:DUF6415 family natural product biosynthesis protein n=1 Tax=Streptomyces sp. NPDC005708 TaxID=3154564 RepID=UPI00340E26D2
MPQVTAGPPTAEDQTPPDLVTMRAAVDRLLDPDAVPVALPPAPDELEALTLQLRGHLDLLMPTVDELAARLGKNSIPRYCALACVGEARLRLKEQPSTALGGDLAHARRLARVLNALCDHFEALAQAAP